jgi:hypothetical protein
MPVTYRIDPRDRMVYLNTAGEFSFAEWRDAMLAVLADPLYRPGFNFLSDRRQETTTPDPESARGAVDFLSDHAEQMGRFRWAAVSNNPAIFGMQRMFTILAEMKGIPAVAFTDEAAALRWLHGQAD